MKRRHGGIASLTTSPGVFATYMYNLKQNVWATKKEIENYQDGMDRTHSSFFLLFDISCVHTYIGID